MFIAPIDAHGVLVEINAAADEPPAP